MTAGVMYLITIVASIPAQFINYAPILNNPDYVLGAGADTRVMWGGLLEVIAALACIGTAVVLFPVVRRQHEGAALGFVTARVFEASLIVTGVVAMLSVVTLREPSADGAEGVSRVVTSEALVAVHDWTFLLGPGVMPGINAMLLGYVMYRSGLVPRAHPRHRTHRRAVLPPRRRCQHRGHQRSRFCVDRARHAAHLRLGGRSGCLPHRQGLQARRRPPSRWPRRNVPVNPLGHAHRCGADHPMVGAEETPGAGTFRAGGPT